MKGKQYTGGKKNRKRWADESKIQNQRGKNELYTKMGNRDTPKILRLLSMNTPEKEYSTAYHRCGGQARNQAWRGHILNEAIGHCSFFYHSAPAGVVMPPSSPPTSANPLPPREATLGIVEVCNPHFAVHVKRPHHGRTTEASPIGPQFIAANCQAICEMILGTSKHQVR